MPDHNLPARPPYHCGWTAPGRDPDPQTAVLPLRPIAELADATDPGRRRRSWQEIDSFGLLAVVGALTILALLGVIIAGHLADPDPPATPNAAWVPVPPLGPGAPVPIEIEPAASAASSAPAGAPPVRPPAGSTGGPAAPTGKVSHSGATTAPTPETVPLVAGAQVSLEPADALGSRVRHRQSQISVDPAGTLGSRTDRATATFTVRPGLGDARCFSFESADSPHFFLRHQNFVLYLQPTDRSALYAADATFCPVPGRQTGTVLLRSSNYPDRYVDERDRRLFLDQVPPGSATAFRVRPPLPEPT